MLFLRRFGPRDWNWSPSASSSSAERGAASAILGGETLVSGSVSITEREIAGTDVGCTDEEGPGTGSTVTMSMSELFLGLGAMRRGFLPEPPGAGARTLVLLTGRGGS